MRRGGSALKIYGTLPEDSIEDVARNVIAALPGTNFCRMAMIIDPSQRVMLVKDSTQAFAHAEMQYPERIAGYYRSGRNPARCGLSVDTLAGDLRETMRLLAA